MTHLFKFILIFNRRVFIAFNLVLYALLLFFFNIVNTANVINFSLYVAFTSVILLMKAVYEFTIIGARSEFSRRLAREHFIFFFSGSLRKSFILPEPGFFSK